MNIGILNDDHKTFIHLIQFFLKFEWLVLNNDYMRAGSTQFNYWLTVLIFSFYIR